MGGARHDLQQGRLSRPVLTDHAQGLARHDLKADVLQGPDPVGRIPSREDLPKNAPGAPVRPVELGEADGADGGSHSRSTNWFRVRSRTNRPSR